jgi:hypothetical protein
VDKEVDKRQNLAPSLSKHCMAFLKCLQKLALKHACLNVFPYLESFDMLKMGGAQELNNSVLSLARCT